MKNQRAWESRCPFAVRWLAVFGCLLGLSASASISQPSAQASAQPPAEEEPATIPSSVVVEPRDDQLDPGMLSRLERRGVLSTKVGTGSLLTLDEEIIRVALADDSVARVQIISSREVLLTGLRPGRTTVFVWLVDGRRQQYHFQVLWDLDLLRKAVHDVDPRIVLEVSTDGRSLILRGEVEDARAARRAIQRATSLVGGTAGAGAVIDLIRFPGFDLTADELLAEALREIDPRIVLRRIDSEAGQGAEGGVSYVLEGRVRGVRELERAVTLADLYLGGTPGRISAPDDQALQAGGSRGGGGLGGGGLGAGGGLSGLSRPPSGLSSQLARSRIVASGSGRVISLLVVDELPQILVSIRVLEIDRSKAKRVGIDFQIDSEKVSIGSFTSPGGNGIVGGNLVGAFVDQMTSILTAIDFLASKDLARSVSEPNIMTLSGEQATVLVGGEIPIPTTTANQVTTVQGFLFQEFGVRLDIRPTIDGEDVVALEVSPSIIRPELGLSVSDVPGFTIQSVQTTARVKAGQSLVIGGLLSFQEGLGERRVPGLGKIPLFRWRQRSRQERELLFVITPRVLKPEWQETGETVEPLLMENVDWPELDFPADRDEWTDDFEPHTLGPDAVPEGLRSRDAIEIPILDAFEIEIEDLPVYDEPPWTTVEGQPYRRDRMGRMRETEDAEVRLIRVVRDNVRPCLNLRPEPSTWAEAIDCLESGTRVGVMERRDGWNLVRLDDGTEGWVAEVYLMPEPQDLPPEARRVSSRVSSCLVLRAEPRADGLRLDCLEAGAEVRLQQQSGSWSRVALPSGRSGWVAGRFLEAATVINDSSRAPAAPELVPESEPIGGLYVGDNVVTCLNVYTEASATSESLECLVPGSRVRSLERRNGWTRIELPDGRDGWAASYYLTDQRPPAGQSGQSQAAAAALLGAFSEDTTGSAVGGAITGGELAAKLDLAEVTQRELADRLESVAARLERGAPPKR